MVAALHLTVPTESKEFINHRTNVVFMGSCFAQSIGDKMRLSKLKALVNPYGVLYNPHTLAINLENSLKGKEYQRSDLFKHDELWSSWNHHGSFSHTDPSVVLKRINDQSISVNEALNTKDSALILTFGSALVYEKNDKPVGNCHKVPSNTFTQRMLEVDEVVNALSSALENLSSNVKVIFTVSPVRYIRDGLHTSNLSKSTLHLAVDELVRNEENRYYFPAFEIVNDELRDYRFFEEDLVHPNSLAQQIVWERFQESFCTLDCRQYMNEWGEIQSGLNHRLLHPETNSAKKFVANLEEKVTRFGEKYNVNIDSELNQIGQLRNE